MSQVMPTSCEPEYNCPVPSKVTFEGVHEVNREACDRLIDALDALPEGFPRTPSGSEYRMIEKVFTPNEIELAGHLSRTFETVDEIAPRVGLPGEMVKLLLDEMVPRRMVRRSSVADVEHYRLGPFVIGWYEGHMPLMDREFAELFDRYMSEGGAEKILGLRPGILRVVPVRGSLGPELRQPHDDIDAHFQRYERFRVIDCVCRVEANLLESDCPTPLKRCAFVGAPPQTPLSENVLNREQALERFTETEEMGLVHLGFYGNTPAGSVPRFAGCCNCCGDCCGVLRGVTDWGLSESAQKSNYRANLDLEQCNACGNCIERCQVHAITEDTDGMPLLDRNKCIGCGQCVVKCSTDAAKLEPASAEEWWDVPINSEGWETERLRVRGML